MRRLLALAAVSVAVLLGGTMYLIIAEGSGSSDAGDELDLDEDLDRNRSGEDRLESLYDECDDGDMSACDDLYWDSPVGSFYEEFGSTCGERERETSGGCA